MRSNSTGISLAGVKPAIVSGKHQVAVTRSHNDIRILVVIKTYKKIKLQTHKSS